jgi:hypothetical protein
MATIETKYAIGDIVFFASTTQKALKRDCPDCLGQQKWAATSPAGTEYEFACPRCATRFMNDRDLSLEYTQYVPTAGALTIGSVQHNTHDTVFRDGQWVGRAATKYMCVETGVGNGSMYDEDRLFLTKEEALAAAELLADEQNKTSEWIVTLYNKTLELSDYQLDNAKIELARRNACEAQSKIWNLGDLFSEIESAQSIDEIKDLIIEYRERRWDEDKEAVASLATLKLSPEAA